MRLLACLAICFFEWAEFRWWPAPGELAELAGRADLADVAERPDVLARVGVLLEALRGAARGTTPRGQVAPAQPYDEIWARS